MCESLCETDFSLSSDVAYKPKTEPKRDTPTTELRPLASGPATPPEENL